MSFLVEREHPFIADFDRRYRLSLTMRGEHITGEIDGQMVVDVFDSNQPLTAGGIGLIVTEGTLSSEAVQAERISERRSGTNPHLARTRSSIGT